MTEINEIKQKIQGLIDKAVSDNENQKKTLNFLFGKLNEIKELETIDRLRQFSGGAKYLQAYLLYKSIVRSNYQVELTKHANYEDGEGQDKLLEAINGDIEQFIKDREKREILPAEQLTNEQLLTILGERIKAGEIKTCRDWDCALNKRRCFIRLIEDEKLKIEVELSSGKIEPNPVDEFLKKHGLKEKK